MIPARLHDSAGRSPPRRNHPAARRSYNIRTEDRAMEQVALGVVIGVAATLLLAAALVIAGVGSLGRAAWALAAAGRANADPKLAAKIDELLGTPAAPAGPPGPPKPSGEPLRLLALLQTE